MTPVWLIFLTNNSRKLSSHSHKEGGSIYLISYLISHAHISPGLVTDYLLVENSFGSGALGLEQLGYQLVLAVVGDRLAIDVGKGSVAVSLMKTGVLAVSEFQPLPV